MMALSLGQRDSDMSYSFGWNRAEVIGTLISIAVIWLITLWLIVAATGRLLEGADVDGKKMLIGAVVGLFFNLIQMNILHSGDGHYHLGGEFHDHHDHGHGGHGHDHDHDHDHHHDHEHDHNHEHHHHHAVNDEALTEPLVPADPNRVNEIKGPDHGLVNTGNMNVDAAYLHILGDLLNSVGVIIAAIIITLFPSANYMDPICTYVFSIIVMWTTLPIVKNCIQILMEGTPFNFPLDQLRGDILALDPDAIIEVHDLHVWQLAQGKNTMSAHIISKKPLKTLAQVTDLVRRAPYRLHHTTVQVEGPHDDQENPHHFECANDLHN